MYVLLEESGSSCHPLVDENIYKYLFPLYLGIAKILGV